MAKETLLCCPVPELSNIHGALRLRHFRLPALIGLEIERRIFVRIAVSIFWMVPT